MPSLNELLYCMGVTGLSYLIWQIQLILTYLFNGAKCCIKSSIIICLIPFTNCNLIEFIHNGIVNLHSWSSTCITTWTCTFQKLLSLFAVERIEELSAQVEASFAGMRFCVVCDSFMVCEATLVLKLEFVDLLLNWMLDLNSYLLCYRNFLLDISSLLL